MAQVPQKPVIGVTARSESHAQVYVDAIERSGGSPWVILPDHEETLEETLCRIGGLIVCGAGDTYPERDNIEMPLLKAALEKNIPVLGISKGMQTLNVVMGGKLTDNISGHDTVEQDRERVSSYHHIFISPGSKMAAVVGSGGFVRVNSRHRQGIREAQKSPLLMASAYSLEDGVIEALESPVHRWVIGVQFQPERRREIPPHFDRLFQSLVERAEEHVNPDK